METLERQHKQLTVLFGNVLMKARTEMELIADCHGGTEVNLVTALGFHSMFSSLESVLNLEQRHEMVTAISVEVFPGVLQTEQKYIGKWREAIETEMNIRHSETYCRPSGARYLVGSTLAPMCRSRYPVHFVAVDVKSTRTIVDEDLERNVTLCLHNSFCRNRESNVDPLPCCKQRVEEQKCWRTASCSVRIANDVLPDTETESAESVSQEEEMEH